MSNTQEEMMELIWAKEHDADAKIRAAVYGLLNATDMNSAFYRYYEITNYSQVLLKLIYEELSTGYWDEEDEDDVASNLHQAIKFDAIQVVRCKDCKHWDGYYCHNKWWGDGTEDRRGGEMREYIVPVTNTDKSNEGMYIGFIRTRHELIRCKDCKWFGEAGCAVNIVDESDEPTENDYCSWAERKEDNDTE